DLGAVTRAETTADIDRQVRLEVSRSSTQADVGGLACDFRDVVFEFVIQGGVIAGERAGSTLHRQRLQTVQNLRNILGAAIDDLQLTDAIIRIAYALAQLSPLVAQRVGDRHAGWVVGRAVDPVPGR